MGELIRGAQGERASAQLLEQINEFCNEPGAWRELTVIPLTATKNKTLFKVFTTFHLLIIFYEYIYNIDLETNLIV